jgi:spore coat polysaccharide biosynthesis protein SpsF
MNAPNANSTSPSVLIRCDGAPDIGLGHVVRCIALADELRDGQQCGVKFLTQRGDVAFRLLEKAGHVVLPPATHDEPDDAWISRVIAEEKPDVLVMDFRDPLSPEAVLAWRRQGVLAVTIDDPEDKRVACDLVFSPPVPQVKRMSWAGFTGELKVGWEWVLLRRQFANLSSVAKANPRPVVLVTMGGSDPAGLTLKAVKALDSLAEEFDTVLVVGGAFCHNEALVKLLQVAKRKFEIRRNVADMAGVMAQADLAVASFCVTAYELAAVGVPGIYLCLSDDHAEAAQAFVDAGIGISLGVQHQVTDVQLAASLKTFLADEPLRAEMSRKSRSLSDGRGAQNVARAIVQAHWQRKPQRTT